MKQTYIHWNTKITDVNVFIFFSFLVKFMSDDKTFGLNFAAIHSVCNLITKT